MPFSITSAACRAGETASILGVLSLDREVMRYCSKPELEKLLNPDSYIGTSVQQVERVIEKLSPHCGQ